MKIKHLPTKEKWQGNLCFWGHVCEPIFCKRILVNVLQITNIIRPQKVNNYQETVQALRQKILKLFIKFINFKISCPKKLFNFPPTRVRWAWENAYILLRHVSAHRLLLLPRMHDVFASEIKAKGWWHFPLFLPFFALHFSRSPFAFPPWCLVIWLPYFVCSSRFYKHWALLFFGPFGFLF